MAPMHPLFDLSGRTALVTGARTGLGQGIALALASAGATVVGVDRAEMPETAAAVATVGGTFHGLVADLGSIGPIEALVEEATARAGRVDILVNNAGIIRRADALDFTESDWDLVMNVNIKAVFFLSQAVARRLVAAGRGGKIINIASMLSYQGGVRVASYTSSKSGVMGLTRLLASEWAAKGINVNAIAPGYMATEGSRNGRVESDRSSQILDRIPAGRWGTPADLGGAAIFLASDASAYVNGATLPVDGGWLSR
jgi:2-deoxy-D-gluconate 3-dehydrogenase